MYIPGLNRFNDLAAMRVFMQANSFAVVVSNHDGRLTATHIPLTLSQHGDDLRLHGHFARANRQWKTLAAQEVLVIFSGPHAYVSPSHYDEYESVPTWNYVVVHAYGQMDIIMQEEQPERLEALLVELIEANEPGYLAQWESLDGRFRDGMKQGIVGFEIPVTRIEGKAKLSQNKTHMEQARIAATLMAGSRSEVVEVGYLMRQNLGVG